MKKIFYKAFSIILAVILGTLFPLTVVEKVNAMENLSTQTVDYVLDSVDITYILNDKTIVESTSFTDVDGELVELIRTVNPDGSGRMIYSKAGKIEITLLSNQDYSLFLKLVDAASMPKTRGATIGGEITGTQYKHVYISSNTATLDNSALNQIIAGGIGTGASIIAGLFSMPASIAISIATYIYGSLSTLSPAKVVVSQSVYEVLFTLDNGYYTHCYHETIKSYDSSNKLIDTTLMYKQSIGG